jgi:hypothetical protein
MLPPLTVAGCAAALAAASLPAGDTTVLRVITAATALTACAGAALARTWDLSAGRRVADLTTARVREEWRTDERFAELETDLEESREIRARLEKKLRGKRSELAGLRTEHADLLRRYATAESERARALEARRRLQLEGSSPQLAVAAAPSPVGPAAYLKAGQALRELSRNAARQQAQVTIEHARRRDVAGPEEPHGRHASGTGPAETAAGLPVREHRLIPAVAAAVLPYARPSRPPVGTGNRAIGGFDFFGTTADTPTLPPAPALEPAPDEPEHAQARETPAEVIDLTAHDETEQLDMTGLRAQA